MNAATLGQGAARDDEPAARLTALAHGGGCGCKLSPSVLQEILAKMPTGGIYADLLVGTETSDDAAVYRLNDHQALIATTDFFMPVVDDPFEFGRIAACNALSDVYAMGGAPLMALALVGMPMGLIPLTSVQQILAGGAAVCALAGIPVAGGHSIDSLEPIYGLAVIGLVHPDRILRNVGALPGDRLILTKALGVGVLSAALKQDVLSPSAYAAMIASTTQLNVVGKDLAEMAGVHAMTDVTGFGLLGHTLEMCRGSSCRAVLRWSRLTFLPDVERLASTGVRTGASARNWTSYGQAVRLANTIEDWRRDLLCDPQTSGGLLIAAAAEQTDVILDHILGAGFGAAAIIGEITAGAPLIVVDA